MPTASCVRSGAPLNLIPRRLAAADIGTAAVCTSGLKTSEQEDAAPVVAVQTQGGAFLPNDGCDRQRPGRSFPDAQMEPRRGKPPPPCGAFVCLPPPPPKTDAWHAGRATDTLKTPGAFPDMPQCKKGGNKVSAGPDIRFHDIAYRARDDLLYLHMLVKAITQSPQTSTRNAKDGPYHSTRFETEKV